MAYIDSTKILLNFYNDSLEERINNEVMSVYGDQATSFVPNNAGYIMKADQYLGLDNIVCGFDTKITIGFKLYPINLGLTKNPETGEMRSIEMPLIDLIRDYDSDNRRVSIYESTSTGENNYLTVFLSKGSNSYKASTIPYSCGMWHYFWIVYNGASSNVEIHIDGELQSLIDVEGDFPGSIPINPTGFYINRQVGGFDYYKTSNNGYIDEVVVFNEDMGGESDVQTVINRSLSYLIDTNYISLLEESYGIGFDDPFTININSVIDDVTFVYVARNDGKILRGSPLFWEVRKVFSDLREIDLLKRNEAIVIKEDVQFSTGYTGPSIEEKDGFLKITNSTVRL